MEREGRCVKALLKPLGWVYGAGIHVWELGWRVGLFRVEALSVPVISVGSLFAGGSGKTPLVAWLAGHLKGSGWHPVILSRGYGRRVKDPVVVTPDRLEAMDWEVCGDEPLLLSRQSGCPVAVHADRSLAWTVFQANGTADLVILDDGFQHRRIRRELDLVLIDGIAWFHHRDFLPAGLRREPMAALRRAGAVIVTKIERINHHQAIKREIRRYIGNRPIFHLDFSIRAFDYWNGRKLVRREPPREGWIAVASIAHPESFFQELRRQGFQLIHAIRRRDHAPWDEASVERLIRQCRRVDAERVVTTLKDWVKLRRYGLPVEVWVADYGVVEAFEHDGFLSYVMERVGGHRGTETRTGHGQDTDGTRG